MARILGAMKVKPDVILLKSFAYFREKFSGPAMSCAGIEYQQYLHDLRPPQAARVSPIIATIFARSG
jgi:hypothetical protein